MKRKLFLILLILLICLISLIVLIRLLRPRPKSLSLPDLGPALETTSSGQLVFQTYLSDYPQNPHLLVKQNDQPSLFIEKASLSSTQNIQSFIDQFGQPDAFRYSDRLGPSYALSLFLDQGLAVAAHHLTGDVVEIWRFAPTTLENFISLSPEPLSLQPNFTSNP